MIKNLKYDKNYISWEYNNEIKNIKINNVWKARYSAYQDIIAVEYNENYKRNIKLFTPNGKLIKTFISIQGRKIEGLVNFNDKEKVKIKATFENGKTYICEYNKIFDDLEKIKKV